VGHFFLFPLIDDRVATTDWQDEHPPAPSHLRILYLGRILQDDETLTRMCFVFYMTGWKVYLPDHIVYRAQVPILYPAGTRDAHDRASLHTLVCVPRRHVSEEEASDVSIGLQCEPDRDGHVTRRAWDRLLLRHLLAPLLARGSVWLHGTVGFFKCFTEAKRHECSRNPMVSSATLPHSGDLFNLHIQSCTRAFQ
jgi:hypothetical protein